MTEPAVAFLRIRITKVCADWSVEWLKLQMLWKSTVELLCQQFLQSCFWQEGHFFLKLCACLVLFHQYKKCHSSRSTLCPSVTDGSPLIQEAPFFFFFFKLTGGNPRVICTVLVYWMLLLLINCGANFNIVHVVCWKEYFYLIVYFLFLFISPCCWYAFWSGTNYTWLERDTVTSWGTGRVWLCSVTLKSVTSVCQLKSTFEKEMKCTRMPVCSYVC